MSFTYIRSEPGLWTVGEYDSGTFMPESDHGSPREAAQRVAWLNGGGGPESGTEDEPETPTVGTYDLVPLIRMVRKEMAEKVADILECTHCSEIARRIAKREGGESAWAP